MDTKKAAENAAHQTNILNNISMFPASMKKLNQWVLSCNKIPLGLNHLPVDITQPTSGFPFETVKSALKPTETMGFILGNSIVGIDLDHCITNGQLSEFAKQLVDELHTYTEISQSGTGLHLLFEDTEAPKIGRKGKQIEIYSHKRFFVITGNKLPESTPTTTKLTGKTAELLEKYFPVKHSDYNTPINKILEKIKNSPDQKLQNLWKGNINGYPSQSEADSALMSKLAVLTNCNESMMKELFTQSALGQRDKWNREDYQQSLIQSAIQYIQSSEVTVSQQYLQKILTQPITANIVFSEETLNHAGICKLDSSLTSQSLVAQLCESCKSNRIPLNGDSGFKSLLNIAVANINKQRMKKLTDQPSDILLTQTSNPPEIIQNIQPPDGIIYDYTNHLTYAIKNDSKQLLFRSITVITQKSYDVATNDQKFTIATLPAHSNNWEYITADRETFASTMKITSLATKGLDVTSTTAGKMVDYLKSFEYFNRLPVVKTVSQTGWINNEFVFPRCPTQYQLDTAIKSTVEKHFEVAGDKSVVIPLLAELINNPIVYMAIGTVLSAPLIKLLKTDNIVTHIYGQTGSGKTTVSDLAFSLFGNPNIKSANPTADATKVGLENYFAGRHDLPAIIEDLNTTSDFKTQAVLAKIPYQFGNNIGRLRGTLQGVNQQLLEFRGSLLTNGEKPLTTDTSEGGGKRRVLEIQTTAELLSISTVQRIYDTISDNYGLFGNDWIQKLTQINQSELKSIYKNHFNQLINQYPDKVPRHLMMLATIMTANDLFISQFLQSDITVDLTEIIQQLPSTKQVADYMRAKQLIIEWILSHPKNFITGEYGELVEIYGIIRQDYIAVFPMYLRKFLEDNGMSAVTIIKQLADDGFILRDNNQLTKSIRFNGQRPRMYCINPSMLVK